MAEIERVCYRYETTVVQVQVQNPGAGMVGEFPLSICTIEDLNEAGTLPITEAMDEVLAGIEDELKTADYPDPLRLCGIMVRGRAPSFYEVCVDLLSGRFVTLLPLPAGRCRTELQMIVANRFFERSLEAFSTENPEGVYQ